ncbi:lantibiotic dehydratase [Sorangium sp. So ce448]|uniref:lantibiotic dehydratase n=1 Tax=Sorangium sp. So ce448 TaxID=3133314 RepID=UPI003F63EF82
MFRNHSKLVSGAASQQSKSKKPLFIALEIALLRAPLLPLEFYRGLSRQTPAGAEDAARSTSDMRAALDDPSVRLALLVASRSMSEALERDSASGRRDERVQAKLLRFLIRMSSRPTPYGMFAGVCVAHLDQETDFTLSGNARRRIRPDMAWLVHLISTLERLPEVRDGLRVVLNPSAYLRAGRFVLSERASLSEPGQAPEVSIRATGAVHQALEMAQRPVAYSHLRDRLLDAPRATPEKVNHLLTSLLEQTFLLSELRPPLTGSNPAQHLFDRLAGIDAARPVLEELGLLLEEASVWATLSPEEAIPAYQRLLNRAERLVPRKDVEPPFQVDLFLSPDRTRINRAVGDEACRAAELLLRLTPYPEGPPALAAYRQAFLARYGVGREVPLLDLLDRNVGLGGYSTTRALPEPIPAIAQREGVLMEIAAAAQRTLCPCVELDEALLARLQAAELDPERTSRSLDLAVFVAARSSQALDRGEFMLVVGPNVGAQGGGRVAGRFAEGLGEEGVGMLRRIAAEEEPPRSDLLWAELVYLPQRPRTANVSVRPGIRGHEIPVGLHPGLTAAESIPLRELVVGVKDDRFYLRWPSADREIRVSSGHMLNAVQGPDVCRFLSDVGDDGTPLLARFSWGKAESFPYLPRVRSGRVVLRPAQWKIDISCRGHFFPEASPAEFAAELDRWRRTWAVPRHVYLTRVDNRLLLDLDDAEQAAELRREIARLTDGARLILQEVLPAFDELWVAGPAGSFTTELSVSLVQPRPPRRCPATGDRIGVATPARPPSRVVGWGDRVFPPGSEWVYLKLYCGPDLQNDLLVGPVRELMHRVLGDGLAGQWFFVRYTDPDPHLRLRFRCIQPELRASLFAELCGWATALVEHGRCLRFAFDTYDREVERYGGAEAIVIAEQIFGVDSSSVVEYLALLQKHREVELRDLVVATTDNLLFGLSLQKADVIRWLHKQQGDKQSSGPQYRKRQATLRSYLDPRGAVAATTLPPGIRSVMDGTHEELGSLAAALGGLRSRSQLLLPMERLLAPLAHMHFNRLIGTDTELERLTLALIHRTREAIAHIERQSVA